jgi:hypothetical protein
MEVSGVVVHVSREDGTSAAVKMMVSSRNLRVRV